MSVDDVYRALWRHKLLIVVATAGLMAGAWLLTSRQPRVYEATTLVRVQQSIENPTEAFMALQTGERLARTYARIATTGAVARRIQSQLGDRVAFDRIAGKVSAAQVQDLELLALSAKSESPTVALEIANEVPAALTSVIETTGGSRDHIAVIQRASLPTSPVSPNVKLNLALALLLGLIFNGGMALLLDALGDRATDPDELERLTGLPVLATVPTLRLVRAGKFDRTLLEGTGELNTTTRIRKAARHASDA